MRTYIKKLQSKPEHIRKQIFFGSLVVCMAFVSFIWIGTLGNKFNKETAIKTEEDIKPFALFGQSISDTYGSVKASVGSISLPKDKEETKNETKNENGKMIELIPVEYQ